MPRPYFHLHLKNFATFIKIQQLFLEHCQKRTPFLIRFHGIRRGVLRSKKRCYTPKLCAEKHSKISSRKTKENSTYQGNDMVALQYKCLLRSFTSLISDF